MAIQPNICGALCEHSVISFLVLCHKVWLTAATRVPCRNAINMGESKTWMQSEFCSWQNSFRGKSPQNVYIIYQHRRRPNIVQCFVNLRWATLASNESKMRYPLKFAGMPQTRQHISAVSGQSSPYCEHMWRRYCHLTSFSRLTIHALLAKIQPDKHVQWCADGDFCVICVLYFQRAACSTFQTCILNWH